MDNLCRNRCMPLTWVSYLPMGRGEEEKEERNLSPLPSPLAPKSLRLRLVRRIHTYRYFNMIVPYMTSYISNLLSFRFVSQLKTSQKRGKFDVANFSKIKATVSNAMIFDLWNKKFTQRAVCNDNFYSRQVFHILIRHFWSFPELAMYLSKGNLILLEMAGS